MNRISNAAKAIRRRMQRARFARHPANDDFAASVREPADFAGEAFGELPLSLGQESFGQGVAFKLRGPAGEGEQFG